MWRRPSIQSDDRGGDRSPRLLVAEMSKLTELVGKMGEGLSLFQVMTQAVSIACECG